MLQRNFDICKKHLGDDWCNFLHFRTVKLTGGLTNDLFLCQNDSNYKTSDYDSTVRSVILRIFGTGKTNDIGSFSTLIT